MFYKPLLYPLLIQVALTFTVMFVMYRQRVAEYRRKQLHPNRTTPRTQAREVLVDSAKSSDNFQNQFEMPVLFYTAIILAITLLLQDVLLSALAWTYVTLRVLHSVVHVSYNNVMHRFYLFACSAFVLLLLWVRLGWLIFLK